MCITIYYRVSDILTKTGDPDHYSPELIDHLSPFVYISYHVDYILLLQTGLEWSTLPACAVIEWIWKGTNSVGWKDMGIPATNKYAMRKN